MSHRPRWFVLVLLGFSACASRVDAPPFDAGDTTNTPPGDPPAPPPNDADEDPPADQDPPGGDQDQGGLIAASSLIITDRVAFRRVEEEFRMGRLMLDVAAFIAEETELYNATHVDQRDPVEPDEFAVHPFGGGSRDTQSHNAYEGLKVGVTPVVFDSFEAMVVKPGGIPWVPSVNPRGNFRLLAVVNRLDLAGDWDRRQGGQFAGVERRWFGEGRLIFGIAEDRDDGPYPMTFIVEYALPALIEGPDGAVVVDDAFDFAAGPVSETAWKEGRARWARVWRELSDSPRDSETYQRKLRDVVALFARGSASLGLRSGQRLKTPDGGSTNEFEYREHYLNGNWMLANRKVRREPFRCAQRSHALAARIEADWNEAEHALHYDYIMGRRNLEDDELAEITELCGGELSYGQGDDDNDSPPYQLRAKFVRFQLGQVWDTLLPEDKRHQFAMGTCTGCHAGETASPGFLVSPRRANEDASLAPFLTGGAEFSSGGVTYRYDELGRRAYLLQKFLAGEDIPTEMLTIAPH